MIRPEHQLHDYIEPAATRNAATVLLLRDTAGATEGDAENGRDFEVLMTQRSPKASFAPSMFVFPGGVVDAGESFEQAAVRECMEELNLAIDADSLLWQSHWITDRDMPKRFDVRFYVAPMPEGQTPVADEQEQFTPTWVQPQAALALYKAGRFPMIFPTIRTIEWLAKFSSSAEVFAACAHNQPHWSSCPRSALLGGKPHYFMEGDAPYGELAMVCPDGIKRHALDWVHDAPVPLLQHLRRLTCGNPSMMTGPGTNTYLIGTPETGYVVLDPGPYQTQADEAHVQAILAACGGAKPDIRAIVCTHSHPDHSPAAAPLQALCALATGVAPVIHGMASLPTARAHSGFIPDRQTVDGDTLTLNTDDWVITLRAIHTPGHAANHVCWVLEEDGLLFSGDHVLNGSTTVIDPPDGNMTDYLDSLDKLSAACLRYDIDYILPAHGYVLGFAATALEKLKTHRLAREEKIRRAMQALPGAELDELVALAYDDAPQKLWPIAMRSLAAHVERLRASIETADTL